jgi:hypothetical protein
MMRSFASRGDTAVVDEPFYAHWLSVSGADHPMRDEVLASQSTDWRAVAAGLTGPVPAGKTVFYQKHMTHHVTAGMDLAWMAATTNIFLIRSPEDVLASYTARRSEVSLAEIGIVQQVDLFDREADRLGRAPPVIDGRDVRAAPRLTLSALCTALDLRFDEAMLAWAPGPRPEDGAWAPAWYQSLYRSTGFAPPQAPTRWEDLAPSLQRIARQARPHYERLARWRLGSP